MRSTLKIVVLAPAYSWKALFEKALVACNDQPWFNHTGYKYELSVLPQKRKSDFSDYDFSKIEADAYISRGTVAEVMRQRTETPIAQIPYTKSSFEAAVYRAAEKYDSHRIAAVGYNLSIFSHEMGSLSDIELKIYDLLPIDESSAKAELLGVRQKIEDSMNKAWADGYQAFVCGSYGIEYATKKGYPAEFFDIDFQQACDALERAIYSANMYRGQKFKSDLCRDILNHSFEAIISIDQDFHVEVYNSAAVRMLFKGGHQSERYVQEMLTNELEEMGVLSMARTREVYKDYILEYKGELYIVNVVPNLTAQGCSGHVLLLQNLTQVDALNARNGKKLKAKRLAAKYRFSDINGRSDSMRETVRIAETYANNHMNILIIGKTGTGKEMFAQSIHNASPRSKGPFVAINCAALPESLLESELFGYVEGAFTGAAKGGKKGFFELAHGGTLFLDEVGEIPLQIQSKLLRALQEKEIVRLGDDKATFVDVRIISATNRPMEEMVQEGKFREDLYYRLDVLRIEIPTLAQRREDIPVIARQFFDELDKEYGTALTVEESAYRRLMEEAWPGNIRQLRNICMRASILAVAGRINRDVVEKALSVSVVSSSQPAPSDDYILEFVSRQIGKKDILDALHACGGNRTAAARMLGISRATIYRKMQECRMDNH